MNRSIIAHYDQLDEGVVDHLKKHWKKYATGAALAVGGIAGAKGALGSTVQGGINAVRGAADTGLTKLAGTGSAGAAIADTTRAAGSYAKNITNRAITGTQSFVKNAKDSFNKGVSIANGNSPEQIKSFLKTAKPIAPASTVPTTPPPIASAGVPPKVPTPLPLVKKPPVYIAT